MSPTGLGGCTWSLDYYVEGINEDLRQFLRLVLPADYENVSSLCMLPFVGASHCSAHDVDFHTAE